MQQMSDLILWCCIIAALFVIWHIIKRMIYALFYVAKKAMEDAKNKNSDE